MSAAENPSNNTFALLEDKHDDTYKHKNDAILPPPLKTTHRGTRAIRILFFMQATQKVANSHSQDLNLNIGDMIAVTYFNKSELYWIGVQLDKEYKSTWWAFEEIPYDDAMRRPYGRFPSSAVRLP